MSSKKRFFVSNSSKDYKIARTIAQILKSYGFEVWHDEQTLEFGPIRQRFEEVFPQRFEEVLPTCQILMVLLSPTAINSARVNSEIDAALTLERIGTGISIVPVLVQQCVIPAMLSRYRCLNCVAERDVHVELNQFARIADGTRTENAEQFVPPASGSLAMPQPLPDSSQSTHAPDSKVGDQDYKVKFHIGKTVSTTSHQYIADSMTINNHSSPSSSTKEDEHNAE